MYFVYVLQSLKYGRLYTGSTKDLERELVEHNSGLVNFTKSTAPYEVVYKEEYKMESEANKRELFFKSGIGRESLRKILESRE